MTEGPAPTPVGRRAVLAGAIIALASPIKAVKGAANPSANVDRFIRDEMKRAAIPGLGVGFAEDGVVRFAKGYGFADLAARRRVTSDTMFPIASITKTVTATAVMRLVDAGKLRLDEPVARYLDFPLVNPHHPGVPITFRHLLMHVSSISDAKFYEVDFRVRGHDPTMTLEQHLKQYLVPGGAYYDAEKCFSQAAPGGAWDYSNMGFGLLGYLASRVGGEDMREQTRKQIFQPLGMRHTSWTIAGTPASLSVVSYDLVDGKLSGVGTLGFPEYSAGMIRSSIADLTQFVGASANRGQAHGVRIVGAGSMAAMLDAKQPPELPNWLTGQGLGWMRSLVGGRQTYDHSGGDPGIFTFAFIDPELRTAVALLANITATGESKDAMKNIASTLLGRRHPMPSPPANV